MIKISDNLYINPSAVEAVTIAVDGNTVSVWCKDGRFDHIHPKEGEDKYDLAEQIVAHINKYL